MFQDSRFGLTLLRWYLAIALLLHGIGKLRNGIGGIENMLTANGLPSFIAYGVYLGEMVAPLFLLAGFMVVPAALVIVINMVFAIALAHGNELFALSRSGAWAIELQMFFLVSALVVAISHRGAKGR